MIKQFETGKTYGNNFICNSDSWFYFTVVRRTAKTVWIKNNGDNKVTKRKIQVRDNVEQCNPFGTFSMSPILDACKSF